MKKKQTVSKRKPSGTVKQIASSEEAAEQATWTKNPKLQSNLLFQLMKALWLPQDLEEEEKSLRIQAAISAFEGIKPTNETEGMLAVQMVATHEAAMECLRRAMNDRQSFGGREQNLKHAEKLLAMYARQIEVLDKRRGKGQQKVVVEHVHVEAGGQAIVGNVETGSSIVPPAKKNGSKSSAIAENTPQTIEMEMGSEKPTRFRAPSKPKNGVRSQT